MFNRLSEARALNNKNVKKIYIYLALIILQISLSASLNLFAQDTTKITLPEWAISESYPRVPGMKIQTIDSLQQRAFYGQPLSFLLETATGAYIRSVGNGASAGLSIRGAGAEKTNFLWNGFHINSGSLGSMDLSLLSTGFTDKIDIAYGPSSSVFGNAGIGASVLLQSMPHYTPKLQITAGQQFGSYLTGNSFASLEYAGAKHALHTRIMGGWSPNAFLYEDKSLPDFPWLPMPQASYHQISVANDAFFRLTPHAELGVLVHVNHQRRGIPPPIGGTLNEALQLDQNIRVAVVSQFTRPKYHSLITRIGIGYFYDKIRYTDKDIKDTSETHQIQAYLSQKWTKWDKLHLQWGLHYQGWIPHIRQYQNQSTEHRLAMSASATWMPYSWISVFVSLSQQLVSGYNPPPTASISSSWYLIQNKKSSLSLQMQLSNGYRLPTLNDRFWTPGGNPQLKAEYSYNIETGVEWKQILSPSLTLENKATGYCMWITDWIAWQPQTQGYWTPINLKYVRNAGLEYHFKLQAAYPNGLIWQAEAGYQFTNAINLNGTDKHLQLIYVPPHTANLFFFISYKGFSLSLSGKFSDLRYIRTNNSRSLPPYAIAHLVLQKTFKIKNVQLSAQCLLFNFTNTNYQSIENRPMPGITAHGGIIIEWNKNKNKNK